MDNNMDVYTLDQIKDFINNGVLISKPMFNKIINSIAQGDMTKEKLELLSKLSSGMIPPESKEALVPAIEAASKLSAMLVEDNVQRNGEEQLTSEQVMQKTVSTAEKNGMTVVESTVKKEETPHITFDINPQSKAYIDNLLLRMTDVKGIDLELSKINASNKEFFTIEIGDKDLTEEQREQKINDVLSKVNEVINGTDKNKDYGSLLPAKVKRMKEGFINDQPDINKEDYKVGYSNKGGVESYYIIATSKEKAKEVAEALGYDLDMTVTDGNKFRINASEKEIEGSKLDSAAEYVNVTNNTASTSVQPDQPVKSEPVVQEQPKEENNSNGMFIPIAMAATAVAAASAANMPVAMESQEASLGGNVLQKKLGAYPQPQNQPSFDHAAYTTIYMVMIIIMLAIAGFLAFGYLF